MWEHRTADELMTRNVVRVRPHKPFNGIVRELAKNDQHISYAGHDTEVASPLRARTGSLWRS
ncbi:hypothetical protein [Streptomyces cinnamoneus]|uniref:hypothetical protein n=1 Tax=Streptomyces cinnamoneus TaxID=53446 RepID=UPI00378B3218